MATNVYEAVFILDTNRYGRDPGGMAAQISNIVAKFGGEMLVSRLWEERRLAYPISGHRKGTYWLTYFRLDPKQVPAINRECQLNDNILRSLVIKIDARIADTLVSHALAGPAALAKPKAAEAPEPVGAGVGEGDEVGEAAIAEA